ncbi:MAG: LysR family transcriptional regulator [Eubacteriales bacterium]|nr:LysR family transcriptional regulator [Eubacteriales bacterium]
MNSEDIKLFLAIYQNHNISKAAAELFLSQSTLSYKLSMLETELGAKLFNRQQGIRNLALTNAGEEFLPIALRFRDLDMAARNIGNRLRKKHLLVSGVDSVNGYFLLDFYQEFVRSHPEIELKVINGYSSDILNKVEQGIYDVGISNDLYDLKSIQTKELYSEEYVCLRRCDKTKENNKSKIIELEKLEPEKEVYQGFDINFERWHKNVFPRSCPRFVTEIVRMTVRLMDEPGCWSIMPYTVASYYEETQNCEIFKLQSPPRRTVYVALNNNKDTSETNPSVIFTKELERYITNNVDAAHCVK